VKGKGRALSRNGYMPCHGPGYMGSWAHRMACKLCHAMQCGVVAPPFPFPQWLLLRDPKWCQGGAISCP